MNRSRREAATGSEREIGHAGGYAPGPSVICVAGLHGNEPAGVRALRRVFERILHDRLEIRGEVSGLLGNMAALERGVRYLDEDMNRVWARRRVEAVAAGQDVSGSREEGEQRELLDRLHRQFRFARGPVYLIDLHTASSDSAPFVILGDTLRNRELARSLPLPTVLGLEEHILGTLMEYATWQGHVGVAIEAGQHADPACVDRHESAVWLALGFAGVLDPAAIPERELHEQRLRRASEGIPSVLEIVHRHEAAADFRMRPGFRNFQRVRSSEPVAEEGGHEVFSPSRARVFLPRYQDAGNDGFFLARKVSPAWLRLSSWLRRTPLPRWSTRLPGVRRHAEQPDTLVVDLRIARFLARKLFHLLGYRVLAPEPGRLEVRRRPDA